MATARTLGDTALAVDAANTLGAAALLRGRWDDARGWFEQSLAAAREHGLRRETATALNNLGLVAVCDGSFGDCLERFALAASMQQELGDAVSAARALHNIGSVHMAHARWREARSANEHALRYARAHGADAITAVLDFMQGATLIELGELDAAERHLRAAQERCRLQRNEVYGLKADYYLARVAARRGRHAEAERALLEAARRAAAAAAADYDLLYIAIFVAELLRARGRDAEAALLERGAARAPLADAFVRALVAPAADVWTPPFDALADALAGAVDLDALAARLGELAAKR
jgi:ATP/maltotriose-dependent transcriptional regulator MalT